MRCERWPQAILSCFLQERIWCSKRAAHQVCPARQNSARDVFMYLSANSSDPQARCRHMLPTPASPQGCLQVRHFSWAFWRTSTPSTPEPLAPEAPEIDLAAVDTIVDMAGPATMDAATWGMIHSTAWPHTYAAEMALATFHDTFGLSWMVAIPVTVAVMRTSLAPFLIMSQATAHKMSKASPKIQDAQRDMMMAMERGVPIKEAQVPPHLPPPKVSARSLHSCRHQMPPQP